MGDGLVRNTAKMSDNAVNDCSPPESSDSVAGFLPRRLGDDLQAPFERVLALDHFQPRLAAAEQRREQLAEVSIDRLEGLSQPLVRLAVELADGRAQLGDRLLDVGALRIEPGYLRAERLQLVVGLQVHPAQALAVGLEIGKLALDVGQRRQRGAGLYLGHGEASLGPDAQSFANGACHVLAPRARALEPRLRARPVLARFRDGGLGRPQRLHAGLERAVGLAEGIGGDLALAVGLAQGRQ